MKKLNRIKLFEEYLNVGEKELGQGYGNYDVGDEFVYNNGKSPVRYRITRIGETGILFGIPIGGQYGFEYKEKGGKNIIHDTDKTWNR